MAQTFPFHYTVSPHIFKVIGFILSVQSCILHVAIIIILLNVLIKVSNHEKLHKKPNSWKMTDSLHYLNGCCNYSRRLLYCKPAIAGCIKNYVTFIRRKYTYAKAILSMAYNYIVFQQSCMKLYCSRILR